VSPLSAPQIRRRKRRDGAEPLVMITAYDEPGARYADAAGVDILLVGDSVSNVVLGHTDTLHVTIEDMVHHTKAVAAAAPNAHLVADLPWLSYHLSPREAVINSAQLVRAGAQSVKLEGGRNRLEVIRAILDAEIPVMGHVGLTPQSMLAMGGFKVQAKTTDAATRLIDDVLALEAEGVFSLVVEGVPAEVGTRITEALQIPVIGIGAGPNTDGQVLVFHDLLGLSNRTPPKFVRQYAQIGQAITDAVAAYAADVRSGSFPAESETYPTPPDLFQ